MRTIMITRTLMHMRTPITRMITIIITMITVTMVTIMRMTKAMFTTSIAGIRMARSLPNSLAPAAGNAA